MASRSIYDLHPVLAYALGRAEVLFQAKFPDGPVPFLVATFRSNEEQDALFKQPTDKKDNDKDGKIDEADERVTNAKAGQSPHNYKPSFAFDIAFKKKDGTLDYSEKWFVWFAGFVLVVEGITWGGNFKSIKDKPHFELTRWEKMVKK
ncbi:M15 family metallopeptidase [Spirosoma sp.]|uniref:M15 family metallopeptidase n=1 Tax=Spirosoma sp. TaxID=1899569 RepID=UPI00262AC3AA|nr:M15 family metallopeptidase [Spirosoma sp.]MCX6216579.1 M15 family metallopeptidase [Spirosoma sp.]